MYIEDRECDLGYTPSEISKLYDDAVAFYQSIRGNCITFCDGCDKGNHGPVVHESDIK